MPKTLAKPTHEMTSEEALKALKALEDDHPEFLGDLELIARVGTSGIISADPIVREARNLLERIEEFETADPDALRDPYKKGGE
jgi:hypothetical protein